MDTQDTSAHEGTVNLITLQTLARLIVAHRAYRDGEVRFAGEVLAGS